MGALGPQLLSPSADPYLRDGSATVAEWSRRGQTLFRLGSDHAANPKLLLSILDACVANGMFAMLTVPASSVATFYNDPKLKNATALRIAEAELVANITLVKDHPALWG
eukprot:125793-Prymnesium_polylepis.1